MDPTVRAAARTATESTARFLVFSFVPALVIALLKPTAEGAVWLMLLGITATGLALRFGETVPRAVARALRFGAYVTIPGVQFTILWDVHPLGLLGYVIFVVGPGGIITMLAEFAISLVNYRNEEEGRRRRATTAEQEVTTVPNPHHEESSESSVKLDARLDFRYRRARKEAEEEVRRFLPTNPRTAKRMVNHVSLAMAIAEERQLFDDPEITQQHLAKWIGISEQWPGLGAVLTTAPEHMNQLEEATSVAGLQRILDDLAPGTVASEEMLKRLGDDHPLGGMLDRLVRYEPRQLS